MSIAKLFSVLVGGLLAGCTVVRPIVCPRPPAELLVPVPESLIDDLTELTSGPAETTGPRSSPPATHSSAVTP